MKLSSAWWRFALQAFEFGGITWERYRGHVNGRAFVAGR